VAHAYLVVIGPALRVLLPRQVSTNGPCAFQYRRRPDRPLGQHSLHVHAARRLRQAQQAGESIRYPADNGPVSRRVRNEVASPGVKTYVHYQFRSDPSHRQLHTIETTNQPGLRDQEQVGVLIPGITSYLCVHTCTTWCSRASSHLTVVLSWPRASEGPRSASSAVDSSCRRTACLVTAAPANAPAPTPAPARSTASVHSTVCKVWCLIEVLSK
jgi:hypothetical protein